MTEREFTERQNKLLAELPEEFRGVVSFKAYQDGHASGYEEILIHVADFVGMLKKPIIAYTARIKQ